MTATAAIAECARCGIDRMPLNKQGFCDDCVPRRPPAVTRLYQRLAANRAKLTKAEAARESVAADRADLWRALIAEGETHVSIAAASGVHKTYIKKELERRDSRQG